MGASKFSVGFVSQDWSRVNEVNIPNGCTWYRCAIPATILNSAGYSAHVGMASSTEQGRLAIYLTPPLYKQENVISGHDIIVLKVVMNRKTKEIVEAEMRAGKKIVVDIDDWFDDLPDTNRAKQTTDPEKNPDNNRDIYFEIIDMAHAIICSTQFLYDQYSARYPSKPVFMVRNSIDIARWPQRKMQPKLPVIGWCGATPWRANDLEQLAPFMNDYLKSRHLTFHHAGHIQNAHSVAELMQVDPSIVCLEPMQPITNLPQMLQKIDIGIVPLNDLPFNHAKSYLKGLEYAAAGIPFVASDLPEYRLLAENGVGRIATTAEEWIKHLDELQEYKPRFEEAQNNYGIVKDKYSMTSMSSKWLSVFYEIMDIKV